MNATEHRQHIKQLAQSQDSDSLTQVIEALHDPATCYTAMCALKQIGTLPALDALITFLANGQRTEMEAYENVIFKPIGARPINLRLGGQSKTGARLLGQVFQPQHWHYHTVLATNL